MENNFGEKCKKCKYVRNVLFFCYNSNNKCIFLREVQNLQLLQLNP